MPNPISIFPQNISGYEPIAFCGFGAYGSVWLVKDETGRLHALKVIDKEALQEKEMRGLEASSRIANCPNLLQIHHVGHFDGGVFYTMEPGDNAGTKEHYEPDTLARRLKNAPNGLSLENVRQLAIDLLKALSQLHAANLVHRDIKPENILYVGGQPKLSDLGLLRSLSLTVSIGGTLGYIPPDKLVKAANSPQFNLQADSSDDLYAMGKLLYCALTGNAPEDFPSVAPDKMKDDEYRRFFKVLLFACGNRPYPHRFDIAEHFLEAIQCGKLPRRGTWRIWLLLLLLIPALVYFCFPHKEKPETPAQSALIQDDGTLHTELENRLAKTFHLEIQLSPE
ncbi:MAG: protein kinase, partial [Victivallales bacterium]|nr:protein kinase [Victivallales bacterium]